MVDRLSLGRIGIDVGAEAHAFARKKLDEALVRIVPRTVEGHVLKEMGKPVLAVLLLQGPNAVHYIKVRTSRRIAAVADVVGHAVVKATLEKLRVRLYRLCGYVRTKRKRRHKDGNSRFFHIS